MFFQVMHTFTGCFENDSMYRMNRMLRMQSSIYYSSTRVASKYDNAKCYPSIQYRMYVCYKVLQDVQKDNKMTVLLHFNVLQTRRMPSAHTLLVVQNFPHSTCFREGFHTLLRDQNLGCQVQSQGALVKEKNSRAWRHVGLPCQTTYSLLLNQVTRNAAKRQSHHLILGDWSRIA